MLLLLLLLSWRARQALPILGGQRGPEEMRNSARLWIWRDPSLPRGSWQPFIDWGTTQGRLSLPTADVLSTIVKRSMSTNCQAAVGSPTLWISALRNQTNPFDDVMFTCQLRADFHQTKSASLCKRKAMWTVHELVTEEHLQYRHYGLFASTAIKENGLHKLTMKNRLSTFQGW